MNRALLHRLIAWACCLALLAGCTKPEVALERYVSKARLLIQQGSFDQAGVELRNAMHIDPKAPEPLYLAGLVGEETGNLQSALAHYRSATSADPGFMPAWSRIGMFMLLGGRLDEAESIAARVAGADPTDPGGRALHVGLLSARGNIAEAMALGEALLAEKPAQRDGVALMAGLQVARGDFAAAERVIRNAIAADALTVQFRTMAARLARQQKQFDVAEREYREVVRMMPGSREHRLTLAIFLSGVDRLDDAEKVLRESMATEAKDEQRVIDLAEFLRERRSPEAAQAELRAAVARRPDDFRVRLRLAEGEAAAGRRDEAEKLLRAVIKDDTRGASAALARGALLGDLAANGLRPQAEVLIKEALERNVLDRDALMWRARFALVDQKFPDAINGLRTVLRDQPDLREALELLARAYRGNGQAELAVSLLRDAVERFPLRADIRVALAEQLIADRQFKEAQSVIDAAVKLDRDSPRALASRFDLQGSQGRWSEAQVTAEAIKASSPDRPLGYLRLAQALAAQKRFDLALKELQDAVARFPQDRDALMRLVGTAIGQGQPDIARKTLEAVVASQPRAALPRVLLGEVVLVAGERDMAEGLFRDALKVDPRFGTAYVNLARIEAARGRMPAAIEVLEGGLRVLPADAGLLAMLAEAQVVDGRMEAAIATLETVHRIEPNNDVVSNNLAALLSATAAGDAAKLARAEKLAQRFANSENPSFLDTLGRIYYQQGRVAEALPLLTKAVKLAPRAPVLRYHLGMALLRSGDAATAKVHLREAVASKVEFRGLDEARKALQDG